jgi:signal transduction histidine kinase
VVAEFLDFARRPAPALESVPLRPLFDEIRELSAPAGGGAIAVEAPEDLRARADAGQLRRVLLNLTRNAIAAARGGNVRLAARRIAGGVRIEVSDDGPGVPVDLREQIFTPFFTTREKGTGLGLAFVREIVRAHGGEVSVRDAAGGGSIFSFDLSESEPA